MLRVAQILVGLYPYVKKSKVCISWTKIYSAHCKDLYLTTHNTHNWWTSMPLAGFRPTISAGKLLYTYAVDHMFTWTVTNTYNVQKYIKLPAYLF